MKRKLTAVFIALGSIVCMTACSKDSASKSNKKTNESNNVSTEIAFDENAELKDVATEMTDSLSELTACDSYLKTMSTPDDVMKVIEDWRNLSVDKTAPIYVISLDEQSIESYIKSASDDKFDLSEMPETVREYLICKIGDSIGTMVNGKAGGVNEVAASSIARFSKTFILQSNIENQIWMIPCNKETAVYISFTNTGNGVLTVTASYAAYDNQICDMLLESTGFHIKKLQW